MKVMTIVGTRPELIRLARVIHRLDDTAGIDHVVPPLPTRLKAMVPREFG